MTQSSFPRTRESSQTFFWTPAFAGVTVLFLTLPLGTARAGSVKIYGAYTQADLTVLAAQTPSFQTQICDSFTANPNCSRPEIDWSPGRLNDANQDGIIDVLPDGTNTTSSGISQGWMYADQFVKINSVVVNNPGWVLHIYTDNLNSRNTNPPVVYSGPFAPSNPRYTKGLVTGLVSFSNPPDALIDGQFLIPLSWKLTANPILKGPNPPFPVECPATADPKKICPPLPLEVLQGTGCGTKSTFDDFATHFAGDVMDRDPCQNPANDNLIWWQNYADSDSQKWVQQNYQSVLTSDGAGTGDLYRTPYSTLTGIGTYDLYLAARFAPGTIRAVYKTVINLEIYHP